MARRTAAGGDPVAQQRDAGSASRRMGIMSNIDHTGDAPPAVRKTVLVVDDNPMALLFFALVLRRAGYHVIEAHSSHDAQRIANDGHHIDLLLTDFQMPEMNGLELAIWLRETHPKIPVLVVTGSPKLAFSNGKFHRSFVCREKTWLPKELTDTVAGMFAANAE